MKCSKCRYYSRSLLRCKFGKINPLNMSIKSGVETAFIMGLSSFCVIDSENLERVERIRIKHQEHWKGKKTIIS